MAPALLMAGGAVAAVLAVAQASFAVLVVAGLLLLAGIAVTTVRARRRLARPGQKVALVAGVVALGAAIFVPASTNVDRCARLGRDADLSGCDLSDHDLTAEDLHGADLSHANLRGTDLARANLRSANLRGASLRGADLSDARMAGATVTDADLRGADLSVAALDQADLSGADLRGATLAGAGLSAAVLSEADLGGANLSGAVLGMADLSGADLSGADLTFLSAPNANFEGADFTETQLESTEFVGAAGVSGEDLVAAFGVPASRLAGETARRGVVLHSYEQIVEAVTPARDGRSVPAVQPYVANAEFHPAILFDPAVAGVPTWASGFRDPWAPTAIRYAELVVVQSDGRETVETCQYTYVSSGAPAPSITRYVPSVTIRVFSAYDHRLVAERTFRGGDPAPCPSFESDVLRTEIGGGPPNLVVEARPWLEGIIHPPAQRPPPPLPPLPPIPS